MNTPNGYYLVVCPDCGNTYFSGATMVFKKYHGTVVFRDHAGRTVPAPDVIVEPVYYCKNCKQHYSIADLVKADDLKKV